MVFKEIQEAGGTQDRVQLASGIIPAVDGCEIRPHYFEIMLKTNCLLVFAGDHNFRWGFLGGEKARIPRSNHMAHQVSESSLDLAGPAVIPCHPQSGAPLTLLPVQHVIWTNSIEI